MTIVIEEEVTPEFRFLYKELAEKVIQTAIISEDFPYEAEINLTMTNNHGIQEINREFRGIDKPTDVLSFPMLEYETPGDFLFLEESPIDCINPDTGEVILGDIILSIEKIVSQAKEFGHSEEREFAFLILHSMLHLFGYDHMSEEESAFMEYKQTEILNKLNILR